MSEHRIDPKLVTTLVVCSANICRSPTAEFALSQFSSLHVQSAGIDAADGAEICPAVADRLSAIAGGSEYVEEFASKSIDAVELHRFELILTATTSIRGALVQKYPEIRDKTFALREADQLSQRLITPDEAKILENSGPSEVLIRRRGTLPTPVPERRWLRGTAPSPFDLVDTHGVRSKARHSETISQALQVGSGLGETIARWCALPKL